MITIDIQLPGCDEYFPLTINKAQIIEKLTTISASEKLSLIELFIEQLPKNDISKIKIKEIFEKLLKNDSNKTIKC